MFSLVPYVSALLYWVLFFLIDLWPGSGLMFGAILIVWYIVTVVYVGRRHLRSDLIVWLSGLIYVIASFGMTMIINTSSLRHGFILLSGLLMGVWFEVILHYIRDTKAFLAKFYLQFLSFIYLVIFWQIFVVIFALQVLYDYPLWALSLIMVPCVAILTHGIIRIQPLRKSSEPLVVLILLVTTIEFFAILHLLPFHYITLATMITVWFFYIIEMVFAGQAVSSRKRLFRTYTSIMIAALIILLATARWI
jgi:hypothetical protein